MTPTYILNQIEVAERGIAKLFTQKQKLQEKLGKLIQKARYQKRIKQATLAKKAGIKAASLCNIESGKPASSKAYGQIINALKKA